MSHFRVSKGGEPVNDSQDVPLSLPSLFIMLRTARLCGQCDEVSALWEWFRNSSSCPRCGKVKLYREEYVDVWSIALGGGEASMFLQDMTRALLSGKTLKARLGRYRYQGGKVCVEDGGEFREANIAELQALYAEGGAVVDQSVRPDMKMVGGGASHDEKPPGSGEPE